MADHRSMSTTELSLLANQSPDAQSHSASIVGEKRPIREAVIYLALTYAVGVALALAIPGTIENPGPVSMFSIFIPATIVGLIRLHAGVTGGPAKPRPIGLRRLALRSGPVAIVASVAAMASSFATAYALGGSVALTAEVMSAGAGSFSSPEASMSAGR